MSIRYQQLVFSFSKARYKFFLYNVVLEVVYWWTSYSWKFLLVVVINIPYNLQLSFNFNTSYFKQLYMYFIKKNLFHMFHSEWNHPSQCTCLLINAEVAFEHTSDSLTLYYKLHNIVLAKNWKELKDYMTNLVIPPFYLRSDISLLEEDLFLL